MVNGNGEELYRKREKRGGGGGGGGRGERVKFQS